MSLKTMPESAASQPLHLHDHPHASVAAKGKVDRTPSGLDLSVYLYASHLAIAINDGEKKKLH
ncbi:hypothetical protein ACN27F_07580 [Solwaraspora sp. WMMB335]|uniref:hypothetical protein n=1 Tax=Solwaraspora sp. WMMB335 TaxID=3404118 RepID=UPI003B963414